VIGLRGLCLVLLFVAAAARADEPTMFAEQAGSRGFLYEVRPKRKDQTGKLWLYGTLHVGQKDETPFTHAVKAALAESTRLALEADPSNVGAVLGAFRAGSEYPAGDSLERHVSPETQRALQGAAQRYGMSMAQLSHMRLWLVPMMFALQEARRAGYDSQYGAEFYLAAYAKHRGLPIVEIEGAAAQVAMLSSLPEALQREALEDFLAELKDGKAQEKLAKVIRFWEESDRKAGEQALAQMARSKRHSERVFKERMVDDRNVKMADRAMALLAEGGVTFFGVGSLHLFGDKGLVALLGRRGLSIRPVAAATRRR
jgi:uncharacterized protein